jgi:hypothetical protein
MDNCRDNADKHEDRNFRFPSLDLMIHTIRMDGYRDQTAVVQGWYRRAQIHLNHGQIRPFTKHLTWKHDQNWLSIAAPTSPLASAHAKARQFAQTGVRLFPLSLGLVEQSDDPIKVIAYGPRGDAPKRWD